MLWYIASFALRRDELHHRFVDAAGRRSTASAVVLLDARSSASVCACSLPVSSVPIGDGSWWRAIRSVITMSSAPRLVACTMRPAMLGRGALQQRHCAAASLASNVADARGVQLDARSWLTPLS